MMRTKGPKITDPFLMQEALHMASFLMRSVDTELLEHPAIRDNESWLALARNAHDSLFDLYQAIGAKGPSDEGKDP